MLRTQYLLAFLIYYALAETRIQKAKVGQRVVLDVGQHVSRWRRVRDYETDEFIRHCSKFETGESCQGFVNDDGEPVDPPSNAYVDDNGKLIFHSFLETDAGFYMSPDEKPLVTTVKRTTTMLRYAQNSGPQLGFDIAMILTVRMAMQWARCGGGQHVNFI